MPILCGHSVSTWLSITPQLWNPDKTQRIVHGDFLPAEIDERYHPEGEVVGDLAHFLWMLNERLDAHGDLLLSLDHQRDACETMRVDLAEYANDEQEGSIRPQKALWDCRQVLGPEDILLADVGAHKRWIARHYHCDEPNTCLIPNGFCSMGFALPDAIAASLVYPERKVLGIAGDAGFLMNVQEMETAKRLNYNLVKLVWEDNEYGLIVWKQQNEFGRHTDLAFNNPEWPGLAASFGWNGHRCENSSELNSTLQAAFAEAGPNLVVIPIDYREKMLLTKTLGEIAAR